MQGTVHEFDSQTGDGSVLLDDGLRVPFAGEAFRASGLLMLRTGQRLTIAVADGRVVRMTLLGV